MKILFKNGIFILENVFLKIEITPFFYNNFFGWGDKGGSPRGGFRGAEPPDAGEVFKKFVKKSMKNLQLF